MKFSFLVWNLRHFKGNLDRLSEAGNLISRFNPDIFGLIEFQAKDLVRKLMFDKFPQYDFAVTDSKMGLEMVVGWRRGKFDQIVWTQKRDFQNRNINLRPGGLLSANFRGEFYNLLFLHTDSGAEESDYRNRQAMFKKIWKLRTALERSSRSNKANLIALGDLNTMGNGASISGKDEIKKLADKALKNNMNMLSKDHDYTWHQWKKGSRGRERPLKVSELASAMQSNLDHVISSNEIQFENIDSSGNKIKVAGWNELGGRKLADHLWYLSDHAILYGKVL